MSFSGRGVGGAGKTGRGLPYPLAHSGVNNYGHCSVCIWNWATGTPALSPSLQQASLQPSSSCTPPWEIRHAQRNVAVGVIVSEV